ncbi:low temperature requirement protein A [Alkalihalobacterium sp. APHAB7]|uniref:low temperature requirement protein A n=1 Tax=Alkalihalobacterium sp. APHAB7 TaxID=3402081 RepID=UPI003AAA4E10
MKVKKATWVEKFYDIISVSAIGGSALLLLHVEQGVIPLEHLVKFVLILIPVWWAWVGQTLFYNRFAEDFSAHRSLMIIQILFILLMTASLSVNFDPYYIPFLIGYAGVRLLTLLQYLWVSRVTSGDRQRVAKFLGYSFLIGLSISLSSVFFDSWVRYLVLYLGIFIDMLAPIIGRKILIKIPTDLSHLLERFGLLTFILIGTSIVRIIATLQPEQGNLESISFALLSFTILITIWWQYFGNVEKKLNKGKESTGQPIIYGHLLLFISINTIVATIQLAFLNDIDYQFLLIISLVAVIIYILSVTLIFYQYRLTDRRLNIYHLALILVVLIVVFLFNLFITVPNIVIFIQLVIFLIIHTKIST